jgi:uncharacterized membrane protein required for colicin V production
MVSGVILGIKKGFLLTVAKPVRWVAAIAIALSFASLVGKSVIQPLIEAPITNQITEYLVEKCPDITPANASDKLPTLLKVAASIVGVDVSMLKQDTAADFISVIVTRLATPAVSLISTIIAFFLLYFVSKILLSIAVKLLNGIFSGGVLGAVNKTVGCVFGLCFSFMVAWLFTCVFSYVVNFPIIASTEWGSSFTGGYVYRFLESITPIELLLSF